MKAVGPRSGIKDPIVVDPPGFDCAAGWKECGEYVEKCGGLVRNDGELNWRAAFGADPGCCTCPACHQSFWSWGRLIECTECHFRFPPNWWGLYSDGVNQRNRELRPTPYMLDPANAAFCDWLTRSRDKRLASPYYRYGYEHPVPDAWQEHDKIDWRKELESGSGETE